MDNELNIQPLGLPKEEGKPYFIAGPCSAETEEQVLTTAQELAANGVKIFRAGVWKPRTKPGCFEGNGEIALPWLKAVKEQTGMLITTEVATPQHVDLALKAGVDIFWIGARTTANPFAVQEIANALSGVDIPVLIKNPINPDVELWIGAIERMNRAGITRIGVIHRGFSSYDKKIYRYHPMWQIPIELRRRIPQLPMICDPSHMGGNRTLVAPLAQQALDINMDGLMIECHCNPDSAWSDAKQQITPQMLREICEGLVIRRETEETEHITLLRKQIDDIDSQIIDVIAKRMMICREIGKYKKEHGMTVFHTSRYSEIIENREAQSGELKVSKDCIKRIFEEIHQESVRQQIEIINNKRK